jgi:hypothetical protein
MKASSIPEPRMTVHFLLAMLLRRAGHPSKGGSSGPATNPGTYQMRPLRNRVKSTGIQASGRLLTTPRATATATST